MNSILVKKCGPVKAFHIEGAKKRNARKKREKG